MKKLSIIVTLLAVVAFSGTAYAQQTQQAPGAPSAPSETMATEGQPMKISRASEIIGLEVQSQDNEKLGELSDMILGDDGRVEYLVVSEGGVVGIGEKHVALPWDAAQAQFHENAVTVAFDKDAFDNAPSFGSWNEFESGNYEQTVRGYFEESQSGYPGATEPGSETRGPEKNPESGVPGALESGSGTAPGTGTGSQQTN